MMRREAKTAIYLLQATTDVLHLTTESGEIFSAGHLAKGQHTHRLHLGEQW